MKLPTAKSAFWLGYTYTKINTRPYIVGTPVQRSQIDLSIIGEPALSWLCIGWQQSGEKKGWREGRTTQGDKDKMGHPEENSCEDRTENIRTLFIQWRKKNSRIEQLEGEGGCCWQHSQSIPECLPLHVAAPEVELQDSKA